MRYRYLDDFRRGISVFGIFSNGIAVLGTLPPPPHAPLVNYLQTLINIQKAYYWDVNRKKDQERLSSR